jgi:hypothetical protein
MTLELASRLHSSQQPLHTDLAHEHCTGDPSASLDDMQHRTLLFNFQAFAST